MKMNYWIIGGVVIALVIIAAAYFYGRYHPDSDMIGQLTEQIRQEMVKQYDKRLADLDKQLKASQAAYAESQKRYNTIITKLQEIKNARNEIKPPQNMDELTARFNSLGYTPMGK